MERKEKSARTQNRVATSLRDYQFVPCPLSRVPRPVRAFTLTELLTVIAIIAILMGLLVAFYRPSREQRKVFECQNHLQVIHRALRLYMLDWEGFPASPYDSLDNDNDGRFDEDPPDGRDNDGDGKGDEDPPDALVGGLLALLPKTAQGPQGLVSVGGYLRTQATLLCPADPQATSGSAPPTYSSYQGCDEGTSFIPANPPFLQAQSCPQGIPTYAITRFLTNDPCHPSNPNFLTQCTDPDKFRQLGIRNTSPYFPNPTFPADDTVVTWCVHHRFMPNTTTPNYAKGGEPADVVLYLDGSVRIQQMRAPNFNWRRRPSDP
jgi:prepilin-type N-terminal cleavage/methylation domain-containing protein